LGSGCACPLVSNGVSKPIHGGVALEDVVALSTPGIARSFSRMPSK
jgi:hypothetical protein